MKSNSMTFQALAAAEDQLRALAATILPEGFDFTLNVFFVPSDQHKAAEDIQAATLDFLNVPKEKLLSKSRKTEIVKARKFIAYLVKTFTRLPLKKIANYAGHRNEDHSAVLHSVQTLKDWIDTDEQIREQYETLHNDLLNKFQLC